MSDLTERLEAAACEVRTPAHVANVLRRAAKHIAGLEEEVVLVAQQNEALGRAADDAAIQRDYAIDRLALSYEQRRKLAMAVEEAISYIGGVGHIDDSCHVSDDPRPVGCLCGMDATLGRLWDALPSEEISISASVGLTEEEK